jgi:hypothetical protein
MDSWESSLISFHTFRHPIHILQVRGGSQDKSDIQQGTMCYLRSQDMRKSIQGNTQVHGSVLLSCLLHNIIRACLFLSRLSQKKTGIRLREHNIAACHVRLLPRVDLRHICLATRPAILTISAHQFAWLEILSPWQ